MTQTPPPDTPPPDAPPPDALTPDAPTPDGTKSSDSSEYPAEVQACIDEHLDAVDRALHGEQMSRSERRLITDDVENQIRDMLADRCEVKPTTADVKAVLAELDPPEAYGECDPEPSALGKVGKYLPRDWAMHLQSGDLSLGLALGGVVVLVIGLLFGLSSLGFFLTVVVELAALVCGFVANRTTAARAGKIVSIVVLLVLIMLAA